MAPETSILASNAWRRARLEGLGSMPGESAGFDSSLISSPASPARYNPVAERRFGCGETDLALIIAPL